MLNNSLQELVGSTGIIALIKCVNYNYDWLGCDFAKGLNDKLFELCRE